MTPIIPPKLTILLKKERGSFGEVFHQQQMEAVYAH